MPSVLHGLHVWIDDVPRSGPLNMAIDEALLATTRTTVLRTYRWDAPWVSIGCFVRLSEASTAFPGRPIVRRWTGGGVVDHTSDWTYSLIVPAGEPLAALGTVDSYRAVHQALAEALTECGRPAFLASAEPAGLGGLCFQNPVLADVINDHGKIAGAAQRRTRRGLLHQGSVQGIDIPQTVTAAFARSLHPVPSVRDDTCREECLRRSEETVEARYSRLDWLHRR